VYCQERPTTVATAPGGGTWPRVRSSVEHIAEAREVALSKNLNNELTNNLPKK